MAFQSAFTGAQMESVFKRVTDMVTGTLEFTASMDGHGYGFVYELDFGGANPKVFATVRGIDSEINGTAGVSPTYNPSTNVLMVKLYGDGIIGGNRYAVDYLLVE